MTSTRFEDRLLVELREVVAERPAPSAAPPPRRRRRPTPRLVLTGAATAAVAAGALIVALGGDSTAPAFAVERQADGNVTVTIHRLSDADDLQRQLRAAGIPAVVDYTPPGKACRQPRGAAPSRDDGAGKATSAIETRGDGSMTFTIARGSVGPGETLVVSTSGGADASTVGMQIVDGPVSPCQLVEAPMPPPADPGAPGAKQGTTRGAGDGRSLHIDP